MIAFGLTNQVLTLYLQELGISEVKIGYFMALTMVGDSIISYILTWNANQIGNRFIMLLGSFLMIVAGVVFASGTSNFQYLLFAAIVGVISPSGGDTGPFKTIEETVLANLTPPNHRPEIYAIHGILASVGGSLGSFIAGSLINYFTNTENTNYKVAYQYSFIFLVFISIIKFISLLFISHKAEPSYVPTFKVIDADNSYSSIDSTNHQQDAEISCSSSLMDNTATDYPESRPLVRIESKIEHPTITGLSPSTQSILFKLLVPFMMDSFGYGFITNAWVVYYFKNRYEVSAFILGLLFSIAGIAMSISALPSAWFAKKFGPIKSSILTQIPCALFFMAIPVLGFNFNLASMFFILNQMTTAFDVVPRQIILTSLIEPIELSRVMGSVNICKQIARSISPCFTGYFAEFNSLWMCFIINGCLLILANVILAIDFSDLDLKVKRMEQIQHRIE